MQWFSEVLRLLATIAENSAVVAKTLVQIKRAIVFSTYRPGPVGWVTLTEGANNMATGYLTIPLNSAADVVKRVITISINGGESVTQELGHVDKSEEITVQEGDVVTGTVVDYDDADPANASIPRDFSVTVSDTIAPAQPGEVGFVMTNE